jgi:hypothetical protein
MAVCSRCEKDMADGTSCVPEFWPGGVSPIPYGEEARPEEWGEPWPTCHDCGAPIGGFHHDGCDWEECPVCHGQALGDGCWLKVRAVGKQLGAEYSLADVVLLTGAPQTKILAWARARWLKPGGRKLGIGSGHHRRFVFRDLVDVAIGLRLSAFHIPFPGFFADVKGERFRDLVVDLSGWQKLSDAELIELATGRWTEDDWYVALGFGKKKRDRDEYLKAEIKRWRAESRRWSLFRNPRTRPAGFFGLFIFTEKGRYSLSYSDRLADLRAFDAALVLNLGEIFADLESQTGDWWGDD